MMIHRMPGNRRTRRIPSAPQRFPLRGKEGDKRSLSDYNSPSYQAPGTPGSNLSETTGYYSTQSTSLPSVCSAAISPSTPDVKTGMTSFGHRVSPSLHLKSVPSQTSTSQQSGYETDQTGFDSHFRDSSVTSSTTNNTYTSRPTDLSPYSRPLCLGGNIISRTRMSSQSSYGGSSQLSSVLSPKSDATSTSRFPYSSSRNNHQPSPSFLTTVPHGSFSVDRLESRAPRRTSADHHVTSSSSLGPHSMSLSNVYRMELGKRTNV